KAKLEMSQKLVRLAMLLGLGCHVHVALAQDESGRRIIVGGLNEQGHFVYRFKSDKPLIQVEADEPKLPKTIRLTNRSGRTLKIQVFDGGDHVRLAPRTTISLASGKSHSLPFRSYQAKIFEPGVLDKLVHTAKSFAADTAISRKGRSYVLTSQRGPFSVRNLTKETLQVSVFSRSDTSRIVPAFVLTCPAGKTSTWNDPLIAPFRIRVHPDRALSAPVSTDREANALSSVEIRSVEWSPWKTLMKQKIVNGRVAESKDPFALPSLGDLTVDPVALTNSGSNRNRMFPQLLGRMADGRLYSLALDDGELSDGLAKVERSTDWRMASTGDGDIWSFGRFESTPWLVNQKLLFARGNGGDLIYKPFFLSSVLRTMNETGPWRSLGGAMTGRPSAAGFGEPGKERSMVFVRSATNGSLSSRTSNVDGSWGEWQDLGGAIVGDPVGCAVLTGSFSDEGFNPVVDLEARIHAFARGLDGALLNREWIEGSGWKPWVSLGGKLTSAPYAQGESRLINSGNKRTYRNRVHVTAKGSQGETLYRSFEGTKWSAWTSLGTWIVSSPIVFLSDERG
ncbi:MAG TPA: hypothetical protein PLX06_11475, partial [Fimbriimonadaceae bacterium]|nr:hypothetical protein [Fimbriimonadaceae bacterium]